MTRPRRSLLRYSLLVTALIMSLPAIAGEVVIADPVIEARIRNILELDPGDPIDDEDLATVSELDVSGFAVQDLSGLEFAVGLVTLNLSDNLISDVSDLSGLPALRNLDLSSNRIVDVSPLSDIPSLMTLNLEDNMIADVAPLVRNVGLAANDTVLLTGNPLTLEAACDDIPRLEERGVTVERDVVCPGSVNGTVVNAGNGAIIDCATLVATAPLVTEPAIAVTDLNGAYEFDSVASGLNILEVFAPDFTRASDDVDVPEEMNISVPFALQPLSGDFVPIFAFITDTFGQPLGGVEVEAANGTRVLDRTYTCATGAFETVLDGSNLPDAINWTFAAPGYQTRTENLPLTKGVVTFELMPLQAFDGAITGTVTDAGSMEGVENARVVVKAADGGVSITGITNAAGQYTVQNLATGDYIVKATSPDHPGEDDRETVAVADQAVVQDFEFGFLPPDKRPGCGIATGDSRTSGAADGIVMLTIGLLLISIAKFQANKT